MCRYIFFICAIACPRTTYIRFPFNFIDKIDTSHIFSWKYNLLKRQNNVTKVEGELKGCPLCCPTSAFKSLLYLHNSPKYYGVLDNQLGLIITMRHINKWNVYYCSVLSNSLFCWILYVPNCLWEYVLDEVNQIFVVFIPNRHNITENDLFLLKRLERMN